MVSIVRVAWHIGLRLRYSTSITMFSCRLFNLVVVLRYCPARSLYRLSPVEERFVKMCFAMEQLKAPLAPHPLHWEWCEASLLNMKRHLASWDRMGYNSWVLRFSAPPSFELFSLKSKSVGCLLSSLSCNFCWLLKPCCSLIAAAVELLSSSICHNSTIVRASLPF